MSTVSLKLSSFLRAYHAAIVSKTLNGAPRQGAFAFQADKKHGLSDVLKSHTDVHYIDYSQTLIDTPLDLYIKDLPKKPTIIGIDNMCTAYTHRMDTKPGQAALQTLHYILQNDHGSTYPFGIVMVDDFPLYNLLYTYPLPLVGTMIPTTAAFKF